MDIRCDAIHAENRRDPEISKRGVSDMDTPLATQHSQVDLLEENAPERQTKSRMAVTIVINGGDVIGTDAVARLSRFGTGRVFG
jgi:hypothetical protein